MNAKNIILILLILLLVVIVSFLFIQLQKKPIDNELVHEHADFKVFLNEQEFNFAQKKFISDENNSLNHFIHLHDLNGNIIHKHFKGVTLKQFFESMNIKFDSNCFVLDDNSEYCNKGNKTLKFYVNSKKNFEFEKYELQDLDKILISYGNENEEAIKQQLASITDGACIQSGKCLEKGKPIDESTCLTEIGCTA